MNNKTDITIRPLTPAEMASPAVQAHEDDEYRPLSHTRQRIQWDLDLLEHGDEAYKLWVQASDRVVGTWKLVLPPGPTWEAREYRRLDPAVAELFRLAWEGPAL